jgi:hypothetical protein
MKRIVLPMVVLMAVSILFLGTVVGASSEAKDPTNVVTNSPVAQTAAVVETIQITASTSDTQNWRHPGVAEDSKGNRLLIFRGPEGTKYYYSYCLKGGTWSAPASIGPQPALIRSLYANIQVDWSDRFHCEWEDGNGAVYASFKDGVWTTPIQPSKKGRYDFTSGLIVRSDDTVVTADCEVVGLSKDIWFHVKGKNDAQFGAPFNITRDAVGSTQPCIAVDSEDNTWAVWKSDWEYNSGDDNLVIWLAQFDKNNADTAIEWQLCSHEPGWAFLPQVAVNSEDKVMTIYAQSTSGDYLSRGFDPVTKKQSEIIPLSIGLVKVPWHTFFSRLTNHGRDFYAAVMSPDRTLWLVKFNETASRWDQVAQVSDMGVEMFCLYSGYDKMLIAWNNNGDPSNVFLTTIGVDPFSKSRVKSVINLKVNEKNNGKPFSEGSLFHKYYLNALTWEANPDNVQKGIVVTTQRIYRKLRTEDNTKWINIDQVAGTALKYEDRKDISADSDYVYAVTCVDDREHESKIF